MIPNCKRDNDTAWIEARLTNSFNVYNNTNSCVPTYRRIGRMIELKGIIKPKKKIEGNTSPVEIFTLPERI